MNGLETARAFIQHLHSNNMLTVHSSTAPKPSCPAAGTLSSHLQMSLVPFQTLLTQNKHSDFYTKYHTVKQYTPNPPMAV